MTIQGKRLFLSKRPAGKPYLGSRSRRLLLSGNELASGTYLYDTFGGSNGQSIVDRPMNVGPGWTIAPGSADFTILNGTAICTSAGGVNVAWSDASHFNATASVTLQFGGSPTADSVGLYFRGTDEDNYWMAILDNTISEFSLYQVQTGTPTLRDSTALAFDPDTNYALQVICNGNLITCTLDGSDAISYSDATFNNTATLFGMRMEGGAGGTGTFDDFLVQA